MRFTSLECCQLINLLFVGKSITHTLWYPIPLVVAVVPPRVFLGNLLLLQSVSSKVFDIPVMIGASSFFIRAATQWLAVLPIFASSNLPVSLPAHPSLQFHYFLDLPEYPSNSIVSRVYQDCNLSEIAAEFACFSVQNSKV